MKNHIVPFNIMLLGFIMMLLGCERQPLDYNYTPNCKVMINIDWSQSGISPQGATAIFYPQDGSKYILSAIGTPNGEIIKLPKGKYNIVVFNQTIEEFNFLAFRGIEEYKTFEVYVKPALNKSSKTTDEVIEHPDNFAVAKIEDFEVTQQMIEQSRKNGEEFNVNFAPKAIVSTMTISFYVKNVHNIKAAKGTLTGMANCYNIAKGCNGSSSSTHYFNLTTITLDDSGELNGTISGTFTTLGKPTQESVKSSKAAANLLNISFLLVDNKTIIEKTYIIDNKINDKEDNLGMSIEVGAGTKPGEEETEDDNPIEIPDVKPENPDGGGLDAGVGDWDNIEIEIPV